LTIKTKKIIDINNQIITEKMISVTINFKVERNKEKLKFREIFRLRKLLANLKQKSVGGFSSRNAKRLDDIKQKKKLSEICDHDERKEEAARLLNYGKVKLKYSKSLYFDFEMFML
jgi:hypothetical protein